MINLGAQYYRPPFPNKKYWESDLTKMKESGLNCLQLWILWGWVEAMPGKFNFEDYDELISISQKVGLGLILSVQGEIQPYWIHREVPESEMITISGKKVVSQHRGECNVGLTPGGCIDNPQIWGRMKTFYEMTINRYKNLPNLKGWDIWNEIRWNEGCGEIVCYCSHTMEAFKQWLDKKYGGIEGINQNWNRRYQCFDDILSMKSVKGLYTESNAFQYFMTERINEHAKLRYDLVKNIDPYHTVTAHPSDPSPFYGGKVMPENTALNRGNDWFLADNMDGIGFSSFPKWGAPEGWDSSLFGVRIEFAKSAAGNKKLWVSELQGGRAGTAFTPRESVKANEQQCWIWNSIATGADTIIFWQWKDEVFGYESSGFGLDGNDGLAEERLAAMKITGDLLCKHENIFDEYKPCEPEVGILFSPQTYYLHWSAEGHAERCLNSLHAYGTALMKKSIPFIFVEEEHLEKINGLKILFLPRTLVTDEELETKLAEFVKNGGTLVVEAECGAFDRRGFYRYPEDRFLKGLTGIEELGRRKIIDSKIQTQIDESKFSLDSTQWHTPYNSKNGEVFAYYDDSPLIMEVCSEKGKVVFCGSYLGEAAQDGLLMKYFSDEFMNFVDKLCRRSKCSYQYEIIEPKQSDKEFIFIKHGEAAGKKILYIFFYGSQKTAKIKIDNNFIESGIMREIISNTLLEGILIDDKYIFNVSNNEFNVCVLVEE